MLERLLGGSRNVSYSDMRNLVEGFGFRLARIKGSHHIFSRPGISELVNLQNARGEAKPYQIRQLLALVEEYNLELEEEPDDELEDEAEDQR